MHDIRLQRADQAEAEIGGDPGDRREADGIVVPVAAVGADIGIAGALIKIRRFQHQEIEAPGAALQKPRIATEEAVEDVHRLRALERGEHGRIARHQRRDMDALGRQRGRERADDIGEPSGLDQRIDLGGDGEDVERAHLRASSIGWVIRQMPFSVRRKRLASKSGSSPTTRPSGICTRESTTTLRSRAERPTSA